MIYTKEKKKKILLSRIIFIFCICV